MAMIAIAMNVTKLKAKLDPAEIQSLFTSFGITFGYFQSF
jgi:hypothetical protein